MAVAAAAILVGTSVLAVACPEAPCGSTAAPLRRFQPRSTTQIQERLRRIEQQAASLPQRVEAISELFLGVPYRLGALGEGPGGEFDRDPLIRFDAFDCTTFVETVMALALTSDVASATRILQKIRYRDGQIGYATRNHFIELDWVPNNVRAGYLRDITSDVAGGNAVKVRKTISKKRWYLRKSLASLEGGFTKDEKQHLVARLRHLGERLPDERATLTVLPLTALPQALAHIPSGTIANLVHADRRDRATVVSHQVLLIRKSDGWYLRHAALGKAVEDDPIGILGPYKDLRWRLIGLNLDVLHDPTSGTATH
jgi:N-acetylmuramoyl-L-alanine amidase-like